MTVAAWLIVSLTGMTESLTMLAGFVPARVGGLTVPDALPTWLTPLSATLLHANIIHLGFNMIMLGYCGRFVEYALGRPGVVLIYLVGAYAAAALQYLVSPGSMLPMIGASGAISALIAVFALIFSRSQAPAIGPIPGHWVRALWLAAAWIGLQLLIGFAGGGGFGAVAIWAHVGGFLAGLFLARPLLRWRFGAR